jgi:ParB family chromosome partitioning protein
MASFKEDMRAHVAASTRDRSTVNQPAEQGVARSALERQADGRRRLDSACVIRLDRIVPDPNQPRKEFDPEALERLAESLKARGQLQPIRVRWDGAADRYVVVVGERRYRAAQLAGLDTLACVVTSGDVAPEDLVEDQLIENALREDLKPIEQAHAYRALLAARGLSHRELAERLQIGHASITRALALLDLPTLIQEAVEQEQLPASVAYEIGKVPDRAGQAELARRAVAEGLNRDQVVAAVRTARGKPKGKGRGGRKVTARTFKAAGGSKVTVENRRGLDAPTIAAALREVLEGLEAEGETSAAAA